MFLSITWPGRRKVSHNTVIHSKYYAIHFIMISCTFHVTKCSLHSDPPGPPINLQAADITKEKATLTWEPIEFDGGSPIKGYYVERKKGSKWIRVNKKPVKECKLVVDELTEKEMYEYRVCAENEAGVGKPCDTISFVAKNPFDAPGQPGQPNVDEITADTANLSWAAPDSDGGSPITNYIVEMRLLGDAKWKVGERKTKAKTLLAVESAVKALLKVS